jgi:oligopeptide/dipeptide ABC transporter ATP-binding protein
MTSLLQARSLTKLYTTGSLMHRKTTTALENFGMEIRAEVPTIIAVAGESGSGKTTLARLLLGIARPTQGEILYQGKSLKSMSGGEWRTFRREVQAIFQDPFEVYNPYYKVDHVLTTPIAKFHLASSKAETRAMIENAVGAVGLRPEETLGRYPHQLSGGQRQRVMIARALVLKPRIILADEPVSMVDASLRATILESLLKLKQERGISLLYITHDLTTAYQLSEKIVILYQGRVAEVGDVELVIKQPKHPYTQLLVNSIPLPDPKLRWGGDTVAETAEELMAHPGDGCQFANRCRSAMAKCRTTPPPLFQINAKRGAACWLHEGAVTTEPATMLDTGAARVPSN